MHITSLRGAGALLTACLAAPAALGAIAPASSGNGELFLAVYDDDARVSYTRDLGIDMNTFFSAAQASTGFRRSWQLRDPLWATYDAAANLASSRWVVMAGDSTGAPSAPRNQRLLITAAAGTTNAKIAETFNQKLTDGLGAAQLGNFYNAVNVTGTHGTSGVAPDFTRNGTSVNFEADAGRSYFGEAGGTSNTLNRNLSFDASNPLGGSSLFYELTQSSPSPLGALRIDTFDNAAGRGRFRLTLNARTGIYTLNYTLRAAPVLAAPVSAVPEPSTWALFGAGIAAVAWVGRRRRARMAA